MAQESHTDDLRNVTEGDDVTLTTTEGEPFDAHCTRVETSHAARSNPEIRETTMWYFDAVEFRPVVTRTEGLRSSEDDPEFPLDKEVWDRQQERTMGYIESVQIHGPPVES